MIPADPAGGPEKDVVVYENAMIFPGMAAGQADAAAAPPRIAFLQIPDMIKLGETWKFIELPRAIDPEKPVVPSVSGIRAMLFDRANNVQPRDEAVDTALKALADYDGKNAAAHAGRAARDRPGTTSAGSRYLRAVVKASKTAEDKLIYNKQVVDSLVAALRTGALSAGARGCWMKVVDDGRQARLLRGLQPHRRRLRHEERCSPGANVLANQKAWMADLEDFLAKHADADEAPEVLLQLASANEFNGEEDEAHKQYAKVVEAYPGTEAAKKAAGSLRRLDLVGKSLALKGTGLQNETIDTAQYRGKTVLVVFWASWATPVKAELPELKKIAREVPRPRPGGHRGEPRQRAGRGRRLPQGQPARLAADLRGRRAWRGAWPSNTASPRCRPCSWPTPRARWSTATSAPPPRSTASSRRSWRPRRAPPASRWISADRARNIGRR